MAHDPATIPLAILGMGCRLPGAENLDAFWRLLIEGRSAIKELPPDRLDQSLYYDPRPGVRGKSYSRLGAVLQSKQFDRRACPIPESLERSADITHLLMCETAAAACRDARLDPLDLPLRNTGVYVGHAQGSTLAGRYTFGTCIEEAAEFLREVDDFRRLGDDVQRAILHELVAEIRSKLPGDGPRPDFSASMIAGIVSKAFGLTGPFLAANSACASSLQALLLAARALQLGRIDMAIVGGASDCKGDTLVLFSLAQSLSATGSRPFDAEADGMVCAEGYGAIVLKTLDRALADGDPIRAVIRGIGVSTDGRGRSLWAPRKEGQIEAMRRAYRGGLDMADLQYIEAHATATQLGDATELAAIEEVLRDQFPRGKKIPITSVKANIGHALEAAGIAGLIKTVLAIEHGTIPPAINIRQFNPRIDWQSAPFYVPREPVAWPTPADGRPRRAAVNAFGIGGLNLHVVLDGATGCHWHLASAVGQIANLPRSRQVGNLPHALHWQDASGTQPTAPPPLVPVGSSDGDDRAVAVVGMGCILPGAADVPRYWDLLTSGRDAKRSVPPDRWRADLALEPGSRRRYRSPITRGGFITDFHYDWRSHKIPPMQVEQADPLQFMLLEAADQAMKDAGLDRKEPDRSRAGVLVGTEFGGDFSVQLQMALRLPEIGQVLRRLLARRGVAADAAQRIESGLGDVLLRHWPALVDETGSFSTSALASRISKTWNMMGGATAIDCGGNSATAILASAIDLLLAGDCNVVVCAAGQRRMSLPFYEGLAMAGVLATADDSPGPFDAHAAGLFPGEGVGAVVLKRLGDARRDGDPVRAVLRGVGAAHGPTPGHAIHSAIDRALATAAVDPADVALAETDGFGWSEQDAQAVEALAEAYGRVPRREPLILSSVVDQIGHTGGASGMASLIKAALELQRREVPPMCGLARPLPALNVHEAVVRAARCCETLSADEDGGGLAAVTTVSRGLAYHVVLDDGVRMRKTVSSSEREERQDPLSHRERARERAAAEDVTNCDQPSPPAPLPQAGEGRGIRNRPEGGRNLRVVFLFPGQGSQYTGMMRPLIAESPVAAQCVRQLDATMRKHGFPTFDELVCDTADRLGRDPFTTQAAMLMANAVMLAVVRDRGAGPDLVAGHSFGQYSAMLAAGVWDFEQAILTTRARCDAIAASPTACGTMLAVGASAETVERLIARLAEPVYVANCNAPDQTVVGGRRELLEELATLAGRESIAAKILPVPCPFHTPLLGEAAERFCRSLRSVPLRRPEVPLMSVVGNCRIAEPEEIREHLVMHMTNPVRYVDLVRQIAGEAQSVLLEVGPHQTLTRLHRRILGPKATTILLACDDPKRPGVGAIDEVCEALEQMGVLKVEEETASAPRDVLRFDATARRRDRLRREAEGRDDWPAENRSPPALVPPGATGVSPVPGEGSKIAALEKFLVDFVVEHTGYPPDVVDLSADLEADLGIDSIKKAQLLGELQPYFDVTVSAGMSLDDFPTLRHVVDFLKDAPVLRSLPGAEEEGPAESDTEVSGGQGQAPDPALPCPPASVSGEGRADKASVLRLLRRIVDLPEPVRNELYPFAASEDPLAEFGEAQRHEIHRMAETVGVPPATIAALNRALVGVEENSPEAFRRRVEQLAEESRAWAAIQDCLVPVVQEREVDGTDTGEAPVAPGLLPSPNERGVATKSPGEGGSPCTTPSPVPLSPALPLIDSIHAAESCEGWVAELRLDPSADPFLREHRMNGKPLLPGVMVLESLAQAAAAVTGRCVTAIRDVEIAEGMAFSTAEPLRARIELTRTAGGLACALLSEFRDRQGRVVTADRQHARGIIELGEPAAWDTPAPGQPPAGWFPNRHSADALLFHGPPLRCLKDCSFQYDGGWGRLVAPPLAELAGPRSDAGWILPPALLDGCLYACSAFVYVQFGARVDIPSGLERLEVVRQPRPGETCIVRFHFLGRDDRHGRFDFALFGDGGPILRVQGFRTIVVSPAKG
jgi:acyl transferase domain-containing protein/acyl carrier protein